MPFLHGVEIYAARRQTANVPHMNTMSMNTTEKAIPGVKNKIIKTMRGSGVLGWV